MFYYVATSEIPGVVNVLRDPDTGKPVRFRSRKIAEWKAWFLLKGIPPHFGKNRQGETVIRHPYVEVRKGRTPILRWVKGCIRPDQSYPVHRVGKPATFPSAPKDAVNP